MHLLIDFGFLGKTGAALFEGVCIVEKVAGSSYEI